MTIPIKPGAELEEAGVTYEEALKAGRKAGAAHAGEAELLALFCDGTIQLLAGAVSPKLVWEGARKQGLDARGLAELAHADPLAVGELMWL